MKVYVLPAAVFELPYSSFLDARRLRRTRGVEELRESDVREYGGVPHDAYMSSRHAHLLILRTGEFEVVLVKRESSRKLAARLRFKAGQRFITQLNVNVPILTDDALK